jgi:hypothetical protein
MRLCEPVDYAAAWKIVAQQYRPQEIRSHATGESGQVAEYGSGERHRTEHHGIR